MIPPGSSPSSNEWRRGSQAETKQYLKKKQKTLLIQMYTFNRREYKTILFHVRFEVFTMVTMKNGIFRDVYKSHMV
jgi:hypothetical protein